MEENYQGRQKFLLNLIAGYYNSGLMFYHIARKFGEFGELSMIRQTKTIHISSYNK